MASSLHLSRPALSLSLRLLSFITRAHTCSKALKRWASVEKRKNLERSGVFCWLNKTKYFGLRRFDAVCFENNKVNECKKETTIELCGNLKCYLLFTGTCKKYFLLNVMVFPMGELISLIRSHIRHGLCRHSGRKFGRPGPWLPVHCS